jgi:hypothetical protein
MMKKLQLIVLFVLLIAITGLTEVFAQQQVTIRDLNTYDFPLTTQAELPTHPLNGVSVTFDAVIVSYPRNSGFASITSAGQPGRLHVFIVDTQAATLGLDGMSMQIVENKPEQVDILTGLTRGNVVRIIGNTTFFQNTVVQFVTTDIELLGDVTDEEYSDLVGLLEPTTISMEEINIPSEQGSTFRWNAENYTKYINRYVRLEGVEVIAEGEDLPGRPWFATSNGQSIAISHEVSLRYRNDRTGYGDGNDIPFNWRRPIDGPFEAPTPGSVVDFSGYVVANTFNQGGFNESATQSTLRIVPWDDGVVWLAEGDDPAFRFEPEGWPNDLVLLGFAPLLDNFSITPSGDILVNDEVTLSIDVILPDDSYTLESVVVEYAALSPDDDEAETVTVAMSQSGNTFTYTFENFDAFTTVDYTIVATARTPENVATRARQFGNYVVQSPSQTAPVAFNPGSGTFQNQVNVTLSSATAGANIFYTTNGDDPDDESTPYTGPVVIDQTTTLKAIAYSGALDPSPITSREYTIEVAAIPVAEMIDLRVGAQDGTEYLYTGTAVVTYTRSGRNAKYIQDGTAGILIDDPTGVIVSEYNIGSQMTNLIGTLGAFQGVIQYTPAFNPGNSPGTAPVETKTVTLAELNQLEHESTLVRIENVSFISEGTFTAAQNLTITDPSLGEETFIFRTNFAEADYIGTEIPSQAVNITAIVGNFNGTLQITPRSLADIEPATNIPDDQKPVEFTLAQNYPNPFNPTTNITYSLANVSDVNLVVYDILGRRVATLVNTRQQLPGSYNVSFDASRLASGTYIYRLEAGDFVSVKKMLLVK